MILDAAEDKDVDATGCTARPLCPLGLRAIPLLTKPESITPVHQQVQLKSHSFQRAACWVTNTATVLEDITTLQTNLFLFTGFQYQRPIPEPRCLRHGLAAARLLGLWFRTPPGGWNSVPYERCVLLGRGLYIGPITLSEESYRMWCIWV